MSHCDCPIMPQVLLILMVTAATGWLIFMAGFGIFWNMYKLYMTYSLLISHSFLLPLLNQDLPQVMPHCQLP